MDRRKPVLIQLADLQKSSSKVNPNHLAYKPNPYNKSNCGKNFVSDIEQTNEWTDGRDCRNSDVNTFFGNLHWISFRFVNPDFTWIVLSQNSTI